MSENVATGAAPSGGSDGAAGEVGSSGVDAFASGVAEVKGSGKEVEGEPKEGESYVAYMHRMRQEGKVKKPDETARDEDGNLISDKEEDSESEDDEKEKGLQKRILKLKINGRDIDFDASDDRVVADLIQKGHAAHERFEAASHIQKQTENFIQALQADPFEVLGHESLKINVRDAAEKYLYKQIINDRRAAGQMTPEEIAEYDSREKTEAEQAELERYRNQEKEQKTEAEQKEILQLQEQHRGAYEKDIMETLPKMDIPLTKFTVSRTAHWLKAAISKGFNDVKAADVAPLVKEDLMEAQSALIKNTPPEKLASVLGEDTVTKMRQADADRAQARSPYSQPQQPRAPMKANKPTRRISSWRDI